MNKFNLRFRRPRINPVMQKELRQLVRSRFVVFGLNAMLLLMVVVTVGVLKLSEDTSSQQGPILFTGICEILKWVVYLGVTGQMAVRFASERKQHHLDLMFTTPMKPGTIVDGKIGASMAMVVLLTAATLPFMALAVQLRGVGWGTVFGTVGRMLLNEFLLLYFVFALVVNRSRLLLILAVVAFLLTRPLFTAFSVISGGSLGPFVTSTMPANFMLWLFLGQVAAMATFCPLIRAESVSRLSPPQSNRDFSLHLGVTVCFVLWSMVAVVCTAVVNTNGICQGYMVMTIWAVILFMLREISKPVNYTLRIRARISPNPLRRLAQFPLFTGGPNGLCLGLVLLGFAVVNTMVMVCIAGWEWPELNEPQYFVSPFVCILAIRGIYFALRKRVRSPRFLPVVAFLAMIAVPAVCATKKVPATVALVGIAVIGVIPVVFCFVEMWRAWRVFRPLERGGTTELKGAGR